MGWGDAAAVHDGGKAEYAGGMERGVLARFLDLPGEVPPLHAAGPVGGLHTQGGGEPLRGDGGKSPADGAGEEDPRPIGREPVHISTGLQPGPTGGRQTVL